MFWEIYQTSAIHSASSQASDAASRARQVERQSKFVESSLRSLESRVDRLALGCQAMWELLSENTGLTDTDIKDRMQEIDLRDGKVDGKMTNIVGHCPSCDRPATRKRSTCLYCGAEVSVSGEVFGS